ncbi:unnamed protein product, partial [Ectocarpus sp. 8 AP-2014]
IISIDRANRLTNEKTSVLVRLKTQNTSICHELCVCVCDSWIASDPLFSGMLSPWHRPAVRKLPLLPPAIKIHSCSPFVGSLFTTQTMYSFVRNDSMGLILLQQHSRNICRITRCGVEYGGGVAVP